MAELLEHFEQEIAQIAVVPSGGGVFEVVVNGELVFSKKAIGRHSEPGEIVKLVRARALG